jgi:hypothetical protein
MKILFPFYYYHHYYLIDIDHLNSNGSLSFPIQQWLTTMKSEDKIALLQQADYYLKNINEL